MTYWTAISPCRIWEPNLVSNTFRIVKYLVLNFLGNSAILTFTCKCSSQHADVRRAVGVFILMWADKIHTKTKQTTLLFWILFLQHKFHNNLILVLFPGNNALFRFLWRCIACRWYGDMVIATQATGAVQTASCEIRTQGKTSIEHVAIALRVSHLLME
jgi:hypothetical protein